MWYVGNITLQGTLEGKTWNMQWIKPLKIKLLYFLGDIPIYWGDNGVQQLDSWKGYINCKEISCSVKASVGNFVASNIEIDTEIMQWGIIEIMIYSYLFLE